MTTRRQFLHRACSSAMLMAGCSRGNQSASDTAPPTDLNVSTAEVLPAAPAIRVDHALFDALWKLDPEICDRFPSDGRSGLSALGLFFSEPSRLKRGDYACTPNNSVAFAWTGGDGEHFSFIVRDNTVTEASPVVLTAPSHSGNENHLIAENLRCFLRLGLRRGYFALSQFAYNPLEALAAFGDPDWKPTKPSQASVGYIPDEQRSQILAFVAEALQLEPLSYTRDEYDSLQARLPQVLSGQFD